jgi:RNA polymerase sigma factor (sigma-70 family)
MTNCAPTEGLTEFLELHEDQVQKIAGKYWNTHAAADFAQKARINLYRAFSRQSREKLESAPYVNSIIENAIKKAYKKWKIVRDREEPTEKERRTDSGLELFPRTDDPALIVGDPENDYIRRIDAQRLLQRRRSLPAFQRDVLRLRIDHGLKLREVAFLLKSSISTVQRHEKLAVEALKKNIGKKSETKTLCNIGPSACCPVTTGPTLDKGGEQSPSETSLGVHFPDSDLSADNQFRPFSGQKIKSIPIDPGGAQSPSEPTSAVHSADDYPGNTRLSPGGDLIQNLRLLGNPPSIGNDISSPPPP